MRLHLPPSLRSALLASLVSFSGIYSYSHAATSADFWQIPDFGGPDFTWTGAGEGDAVGTAGNWEGGSAPSRVDNKGPHLIFNGVDVTVTGTPPNTSDGGGISVTGNGSVSVGLGQWGGNVYVEKGSSLTTSFGTQLKNMEPEGHANIYVDGTLNMTTPGGNLNFDNGTGADNHYWHIGLDGMINLSNTTTITKNAKTWNVEVVVASAMEGLAVTNREMECIILSVKELYMDAQEVMHMTDYSKITALYSRLSVGDEDRDGGESNSIQNQKIFLENYARQLKLTNIRHYIDDDESGRFFDRSAYSRMMEDVENGKIGVCIMKDLTRWGRDYLQVGNAMEIFRRNNVRFIAVNNGIDSEKPDTLEFAPFINIMSEWYAKDISKKVKTGIKTKGMSGKPIATEAPYGYMKDPDNKDFWIIDEEAAEVVRLIFRLFIGGKNRNQIAVYLKNEQIPTPTFYMKDRGRGTCKNKALNEDNRCKWNKATLTHILTRQEYCGDVVNFKTTKHFRDKRNHYVDRSQWQITENVHEPIIDRTDFETAQRILENAPVKRPNGDGEIHPLSGLLFCKDCGAKMHIRIDYRNGGKRHVAYCSEYHKGKAKNPKCHSPHIIDADLLMQTVAEVLKKIEDYSISNRAEFEALVKKNLAMQQTDQTKKQQKRIPQITTRLEQIDKVLNKLYEDNALGTIPQDRYEQMSQKYSEEYYTLKTELAGLQEQLSAYENAGGRAQKFLKLTERHAAFTDLTPAILNEFISRIEVHERDQKRARYAIQHISIYFNYIGRFENEVTQLAEPTEQEIRQMREEIEEAKKEKSRAYHRQYSREYRARNLEKQREYDRIKAREYRARRKAQTAAAQLTQ